MTSLEDQIAMNYPQLVASFLDIFWLVSSYNSARQVSWLRSFPMIYGGICGLGTNQYLWFLQKYSEIDYDYDYDGYTFL